MYNSFLQISFPLTSKSTNISGLTVLNSLLVNGARSAYFSPDSDTMTFFTEEINVDWELKF